MRPGVAGVARVVRDHADRGAFPVQLRQQAHHRLAVVGVEVSRRLVGQQDGRSPHHRAGDRHPLLLAAGQLGRVMFHAMGHAHALQRLLRALLALGGGHAPVRQRQLDVLVDRQVADQVEALEDEAHLPVADAGPLRGGEVRHRLAAQPVFAFGGRIEQAEDRHQGRFAAAGRPGDGDVLALGDGQVNPGQRMGLHLLGDEDLVQVLDANQCSVLTVPYIGSQL